MRARGWGPAALALAAVLLASIAACAPAATRVHRAPDVVTVRGDLVGVRGGTLTVLDPTTPAIVQVTFASSVTPIYAVTRVRAAAIQPGSCLAARAERDATGTVTARVIVVAASVDDRCPRHTVPDPPPPLDPSPPPSPRAPSASPGPDPTLLRGQVLAVGERALSVEGGDQNPAVLQVPADVQVLLFQPSLRSALVMPSCVVVEGTRTRHTVAARRIVDWPPRTQC